MNFYAKYHLSSSFFVRELRHYMLEKFKILAICQTLQFVFRKCKKVRKKYCILFSVNVLQYKNVFLNAVFSFTIFINLYIIMWTCILVFHLFMWVKTSSNFSSIISACLGSKIKAGRIRMVLSPQPPIKTPEDLIRPTISSLKILNYMVESGVGKFRNVSKGETGIKGKAAGFVPKNE